MTDDAVLPRRDWRSYYTVAVVVATLGVMGNGTPPDVAMLVATLSLVLTKVISREEACAQAPPPSAHCTMAALS